MPSQVSAVSLAFGITQDVNAQSLEWTCQVVDQVFPSCRGAIHAHVLGKGQRLSCEASIEQAYGVMCSLDIRRALSKHGKCFDGITEHHTQLDAYDTPVFTLQDRFFSPLLPT